jgi:hypothetical protein
MKTTLKKILLFLFPKTISEIVNEQMIEAALIAEHGSLEAANEHIQYMVKCLQDEEHQIQMKNMENEYFSALRDEYELNAFESTLGQAE